MKEKCRDDANSLGVVRNYGVPGATYRLQFNAAFTFKHALQITEYLHELGITDCYASPIFCAKPGSAHGYDVCNYAELSPALGTRQDFDLWSGRLHSLGMGLLLDFVPNHMGTDLSNRWWRDVLQHGESSPFANWFDINWHPADERFEGKILLPILEEFYWKVLEAAKLQIVYDHNGFALSYNGLNLPLSPESLDYLQQEILRLCREQARTTESLEDLDTLGQVAAKLNSWNRAATATFARTQLHMQEEQSTRTNLSPKLEHALKLLNGTKGSPASFDALHTILQKQHYRLAYWRLSDEKLNYRRFFDVSELAALRVELPEVFEATHAFVLRLLKEGRITGFRVDHPDGLWNPKHYFEQLKQAVQSDSGHAACPDRPLYVVAEKILIGDERLPEDWRVAGTTGYDFLNQLNGLFVNGSNGEALDRFYGEFTGKDIDFKCLVYHSKLKVMRSTMRSELKALSRLLQSIAAQTRYGIDLSRSELKEALSSVIAAFPVYRTYMTEQSRAPRIWERAAIDQAVDTASLFEQSIQPEIFSFIRAVLVLSSPVDLDQAGRRACWHFALKFQQLTGPVMAKGLEDTALYKYNRLLSLNEVGGCPDRFGTDLNSFHEQNEFRAAHWPNALLATATHDTKRGEDLRARINVLSEIPHEWRQTVFKWSRLNCHLKTEVGGQPAPDANDEYFLYQTFVGAWVNEAENESGAAAFRERICSYMLKAIREAKTHTSWTDQNHAYEQATQKFVHQILTHSKENPFLDDFMLFQRKIAFFGLFNSIAQVVLKMTAPGVPDFYQGTELWDYSLVDPDNRRPVDYGARRVLFSELKEKLNGSERDVPTVVKSLLKNHHTGQIKLYIIWSLLQLRRRHQNLFKHGRYVRLEAIGPKQDHVCAFAREHSGKALITITARLVLGLANGAQRGALDADVWQNSSLPIPNSNAGARYENVLTRQVVTLPKDQALPIAEVLDILPVAVLDRVV